MFTSITFSFMVALSLLATPASAVTRWIPIDGGSLIVPSDGVDDLHFKWRVDGDNDVDASPLPGSFRFTGVSWGAQTSDGVASPGNGSVDLTLPSKPLKKGDTIGVLFELVLSDSASPILTEAYWTVGGLTTPALKIETFEFTQGSVPKIPLPISFLLLSSAIVSLRLASISTKICRVTHCAVWFSPKRGFAASQL